VTFKAQYAFWGVQKDSEDFVKIAETETGALRQLHAYFVGVSVMF
jgi:hypothetical protein